MFLQSDACPWNIPVRTEAGRFVSLRPEHRDLNIQVAPNLPFGCHEPRPADSLIFADLQTSLYTHVSGRLGSGRAGFFRGWYLKGVGRTPLAGNWNRRDHAHNSGHLTASAAIREYLTSLYLETRGVADSIVKCEGLLLAELDPELRGYQQRLYGNKPADQVPAVDQHLQALSFKRGDFARPSNFIWLLHHLSPVYLDRGNSSLGTFCELLAAALTPPGDPNPDAAELTPDGLAALLARSVRRTWDHFRRWFEAGVWWGSFTNNITIDGRFLDLETPALVGGPCLGRLSASSDDGAASRGFQSGVIGIELFTYIAQVRTFCTELRRILGNLPRWFRAPEREFAAELAEQVEHQVLAPDQPVGSREQALAWTLDVLEDAFGPLPPADRAEVDRLLEELYSLELAERPAEGEHPSAVAGTRLVAVPGYPWLVTEPGLRWRPFMFTLESGRGLGPSEAQRRTGARLAEIIADLDQTTSLSVLLDKLADLARNAGAYLG